MEESLRVEETLTSKSEAEDKANVLVPVLIDRCMWIIRYTRSGNAPASLMGKYTSKASAEAAIKAFQASVRASPYIKYPKVRNKNGRQE